VRRAPALALLALLAALPARAAEHVAAPTRAAAPVAPAAVTAPAPYELVRELEKAQNDAAMGDAAAYAARPKLVASIAANFAAAPPDVWRDERNARAAVIYLLSGGQWPVVYRLLERKVFPSGMTKLMGGVLAFAEGRKAQAKAALLDIDARGLSDSLAAQLALTQSMLVMDSDRGRAIALLDLARLLMPGTLVEDVALRREAYLVAQAGEAEKFLSLSEQYARRFRRSVYAETFMHAFIVSAARLKLAAGDPLFERLAGIVGLFTVEEQRRILLALAEAAALGGHVDMARFAASRARAICPADGVESARAKLYEAAAVILTEDYDQGLALLQSIATAPLPAGDARLRDAVLAVARQVRPAREAMASAAPTADEKAPADIPASKLASAMIDDAQKQVASADRLLEGTRP
jgi:chemotaxis protein MotC